MHKLDEYIKEGFMLVEIVAIRCINCFWFAWKPNLFHELDPRKIYILTRQETKT